MGTEDAVLRVCGKYMKKYIGESVNSGHQAEADRPACHPNNTILCFCLFICFCMERYRVNMSVNNDQMRPDNATTVSYRGTS